MRFRITVSLATLGAAALLLVWWNGGIQKPHPSASAPKETALKVPRDFKWTDLNPEELRELSSWFDDKKDRRISKLETLLSDGETVITEGCEFAPGEFVFCTVNASLRTLKDGTEGVHLELTRFKASIAGELQTLNTHSEDINAKTHYDWGIITDEAFHILSIRARPDALPATIRLSARDSSEPISTRSAAP